MKRLIASALLAVLAGCATPTPYQPAAVSAAAPANGYFEAPVAQPNRWRVGFSGNIATPRRLVEAALLRRAAELTLQQGFDHFVIVEAATERQVHAARQFRLRWPSMGGTFATWEPNAHAFTPSYERPLRLLNRQGIDPGATDTFLARAEIVMGRGPPPAEANAHDARAVLAGLRDASF